MKATELKKLQKSFASLFTSEYLISMQFHHRLDVGRVVKVRVNKINDVGEAQEDWSLDFADKLLKNPKELEVCAKRWLDAFSNAKPKPTLEL